MTDLEAKLKQRTKLFAHDCVKLVSETNTSRLNNHISGQLIRCSTSVAANYRAACVAQSKKAFIAKLSIVIEEADESDFWLEFMHDENIRVDKSQVKKLMNEAKELTKIFISSRITVSKNLKLENESIKSKM